MLYSDDHDNRYVWTFFFAYSFWCFDDYCTNEVLCIKHIFLLFKDRYIFVCKINKPKWRTTMNVFYLSCLIWLASFVLSIPNMLTYNVNTQIYAVQSEHNTSHFTFEAYSECIQQSNRFTLSIQWFNTTISYFLPLFVLITCYMNILLFLARHSKRTILNTVM